MQNQRKNNMELQIKALENIKVERDTLLLQNLKQQDDKYYELKNSRSRCNIMLNVVEG
jgi:hypothetical protein